jgi:hypothetical protein
MRDDAHIMRCEPVVIGGIRVSSRNDYWFEISKMATVLERLRKLERTHIKSIWCDSKATGVYSVTLKDGSFFAWNADVAMVLAEQIGELFCKLYGGHNGIWLYGYKDKELCVVEPNWGADEPLSKWARIETYLEHKSE